MSEAEIRLFELLDKAAASDSGTVPLSALQEACTEVPYVSSRLTGRRRYQLYSGLLLDKPPTVVPDTFREHAGEACDIHKNVAARLKEVLSEDELLEDAELQGFVCYFATKTGCHFDDEMTGITLALATVIAAAELPPGMEKLFRLYQLLEVLRKDFVVPAASRAFDGSLASLLHLLLQYHDPCFSRHLDQRVVNIGVILLDWVRRLFVVGDNFQEALRVWDWLLIMGDPTMTVYFALSYLVSHRQRFLAMETKEELTEALRSLVFVLPTRKEDAVNPALHDGRPISFLSLRSGKSLAQNADIAYRSTPRSTRRVIDALLFHDEGSLSKSPDALEGYYTAYTALPLERSDFAESFAPQAAPSALSYVVLDCRSRKSFEFARLPTAICVGDDVGFDNEKFDRVALTLKDIKGNHICVFGTGRPITEEFNLLKMMSLHLVQCGFPYVSMGGFRALIPLIKAKVITIKGAPAADTARGDFADSVAALKDSLTDLLPHLEFDKEEARRKAEAFGNKAKEGVQAAKSWGWSVVQSVGKRLVSSSTPSLAADSTAGKWANRTTGTGGTLVGAGNGRDGLRPTRATAAQHTFSLSVNDDDDDEGDLDLITSVPQYTGNVVEYREGEQLVRGKLVAEGSSPPPGENIEASPTAFSPEHSKTSKGILLEIDEEFNRLFGDSVSPRDLSSEAVMLPTERTPEGDARKD
ncbi:putative Rab-GTPase-TBC domain containing protein [Trypanosoma cruzi]|nr:putative Rab-GTPase-TBC domain containing protein [Trypanosoma cruzi]